MSRKTARLLLISAGALILLFIGGRAANRFYTDVLWYQSVGYLDVFWTRLGVAAGVRAAAGVLAAGLVALNLWFVGRRLGPVRLRRRYANIEIAEQIPRVYINAGILVAALLAGWWLSALQFGGGGGLEIMAWLRRVPWGVADPLFGHDVSFYVFSLPVYFLTTDYLLLIALWSLALVVLGYVLAGAVRWQHNRLEIDERPRLHFVVLTATIVLLFAARYWLGRYGLLLDGNGIGGGIGYTDVSARLPAHRALAVLSVVVAGTLLYGAWRRTWVPSLLALGALIVAAVGVGHIYPSLVQRFRVEPNEFAREAPFIEWNIDFTKNAYGLNRLERRDFPYRQRALPSWDELSPSLSQLPLWDPQPLNTAYNELQALFPYYRFPRVEYDRYGPPGERRQVAVAVREFNPEGLTDAARTWQTLRLNPNYVRGMGAVVTPAAETTVQGEPAFWVSDLDPVVRDPQGPEALDLPEPSVFFGQTMGDYVILIPGREDQLRGSPGRDFPEGILLSSFIRKIAFAWRFADINMLFSGEIEPDSRVVFRRAIDERLQELAPFVSWDPEAYPVIANGRIMWIVDGYTVSSSFPLARPVQTTQGGQIRYMRNSVKATVDAVTGEVVLYAADSDDPVLATYQRIFPRLIRPLDAMPAELRNHLRYPTVYLQTQASVLGQYHLEQPQRFYAGQDVWQLPGAAGEALRPYRPTYALMKLPGEEQLEYLLTVPFIARERQNMTAVLIARNDPPHYGELQLLVLPRDQLVPGPGQVEVLIEQDPVISPQFSLWRQAGSDVNLGHLRLLPLDSAFLYVRPVFLSANSSAIPELRRVLVSDGREVTMAPTFAESFIALSGSPDEGPPGREAGPIDEAPPMPSLDEWPRRALELLEEADRSLRSGDWAGFGSRWSELRELLGGLTREDDAP